MRGAHGRVLEGEPSRVHAAAMLALFGWQLGPLVPAPSGNRRSSSAPLLLETLACEWCRREVPLGNASPEGASGAFAELQYGALFHPALEHRPFCPWAKAFAVSVVPRPLAATAATAAAVALRTAEPLQDGGASLMAAPEGTPMVLVHVDSAHGEAAARSAAVFSDPASAALALELEGGAEGSSQRQPQQPSSALQQSSQQQSSLQQSPMQQQESQQSTFSQQLENKGPDSSPALENLHSVAAGTQSPPRPQILVLVAPRPDAPCEWQRVASFLAPVAYIEEPENSNNSSTEAHSRKRSLDLLPIDALRTVVQSIGVVEKKKK